MLDTKSIIANGFLELTKHKNPDKITVIDICKQSNVSRETFYYHFADKYDLFKWMYKQNLAERIHKHSQDSSWSTMIENIILEAINNDILFEEIIGKSSIEYSEIIYEALYDFYYTELSKNQTNEYALEQIKADIYIYLKGGIEYFKYYCKSHDIESYANLSRIIANAMPRFFSQLSKKD